MIRLLSCCLAILLLIQGCSSELAAKKKEWEELNRKTTLLYQEQQFPKAAAAGRVALEAARRNYPGLEEEAIALSNLAMINLGLGQNAEAEHLEKQSLTLRAKLFGEDDPRLVVSLHHLGYVYVNESLKSGNQALRQDAESCFVQALLIMEKARGPKHPDIVPALEKLAKFYRVNQEQEKAQKIDDRMAALPTTADPKPGPKAGIDQVAPKAPATP